MIGDQGGVARERVRRPADVAVGLAQAQQHLVAGHGLLVADGLVFPERLGMEPPLRELVGQRETVRGQRGGKLGRRRQHGRGGEEDKKSFEHAPILP